MDTKGGMRRRAFMSFVGGLFTSGGIGNLIARRAGSTPGFYSQLKRAEGCLAVSTLRFINTVQAWHREKHGGYLGWEDLLESDAAEQLIKSEFAEKMGVGSSLLSRLSLHESSVIPGWILRLGITEGSQHNPRGGYVALLSNTGNRAPTLALATDEKGLIYAGKANKIEPFSNQVPRQVADVAWLECAPLGQVFSLSRGSLARVKLAAFFQNPYTSPYTCDFYGCTYCNTSQNCGCFCQDSGFPTCLCCGNGTLHPTCSNNGTSGCCNTGCYNPTNPCTWACCC